VPAAIQTTSRSNGPVVVNFVPPTAADNHGSAAVVCSPASGSSFAVGVTTVTCTATDDAGNHSAVNFTVTVAAAPSGPRGIPATGGTPSTLLIWAVGAMAFGALALRARRRA
jgi:LPXTG-motif cell wall-anchored protein